MRYLLLAALAMVVFTTHAAPAQAGETVLYHDGDLALQGYWAPSACGAENAPIVLVIHQWMGLGDYEKQRADMLAQECVNAFAIDMYGQGVRPANPKQAAAQSSIYKDTPALARGRVKAALDYARRRTGVDPARVAAIGYCFGGTMALELARSDAEGVDAVISFHGGLSSKAPAQSAGAIEPSVQIHHGAADPMVPPEEVESFKAEMERARADWMFISYANAVHSFTEKGAGDDPSDGVAYNARADERSWAAALDFLRENLNLSSGGNP